MAEASDDAPVIGMIDGVPIRRGDDVQIFVRHEMYWRTVAHLESAGDLDYWRPWLCGECPTFRVGCDGREVVYARRRVVRGRPISGASRGGEG